MPIKAVNHYRRTLLKGLGAATLLSPLASLPSFAAEQRRLYVDGLSFLPDDLSDVTASKLDAYLCDISAVETIEQADGTQNYKRTYKACMESIKQAAKRVSASPDILLQGCQPIIVEGISDQCYLNAIKLHLIRNNKFSPKNEMVFIPSGGVKGVAGITSIISGSNGKLPYVLLDSDKSGIDAKNKLKSSLYTDEEKKLIEIGQYTELENSEVEDFIPFSILKKQVDSFFRDVEDIYFEGEYDNTKPIVPQIEGFAQKYGVDLKRGWKVLLAKSVKKQMEKKVDVKNEILDKWVRLFMALNKE